MIKSYSLLALVSMLAAGNVLAQSAPAAQTPVVMAAARYPVAPTMSHEVATLIKFAHQAQAQYRRSGSEQDLARVKAMQTELANRGFGRATQAAPAVVADAQFASLAQ
jgi:RNA-splicing ligase RtcB